jgi:PLP dependent protein
MISRDAAQRLFRENLARLKGEVAVACQQVNRPVESVKLVAVTKYIDVVKTRWLVEAGCQCLGENRADQLRDKAPLLEDLSIEWHFIGHLQRNKAKWVVPVATLIHSVDSVRLMETLNEQAAALGRPCSILLEANISKEDAKHGFSIDELPDALERGRGMAHISVCGFMGMSGLEAGPKETRIQFQSLADVWHELRRLATEKDPLNELSIGMSDDFELAIAAGSTMIRVGSRLLEGLGD